MRVSRIRSRHSRGLTIMLALNVLEGISSFVAVPGTCGNFQYPLSQTLSPSALLATANEMTDEQLTKRLLEMSQADEKDTKKITETGTAQELKQSYRRLAREYHPDNSETGDADIFRRLSDLHNKLQEHLEQKKKMEELQAEYANSAPFTWPSTRSHSQRSRSKTETFQVKRPRRDGPPKVTLDPDERWSSSSSGRVGESEKEPFAPDLFAKAAAKWQEKVANNRSYRPRRKKAKAAKKPAPVEQPSPHTSTTFFMNMATPQQGRASTSHQRQRHMRSSSSAYNDFGNRKSPQDDRVVPQAQSYFENKDRTPQHRGQQDPYYQTPNQDHSTASSDQAASRRRRSRPQKVSPNTWGQEQRQAGTRQQEHSQPQRRTSGQQRRSHQQRQQQQYEAYFAKSVPPQRGMSESGYDYYRSSMSPGRRQRSQQPGQFQQQRRGRRVMTAMAAHPGNGFPTTPQMMSTSGEGTAVYGYDEQSYYQPPHPQPPYYEEYGQPGPYDSPFNGQQMQGRFRIY